MGDEKKVDLHKDIFFLILESSFYWDYDIEQQWEYKVIVMATQNTVWGFNQVNHKHC